MILYVQLEMPITIGNKDYAFVILESDSEVSIYSKPKNGEISDKLANYYYFSNESLNEYHICSGLANSLKINDQQIINLIYKIIADSRNSVFDKKMMMSRLVTLLNYRDEFYEAIRNYAQI